MTERFEIKLSASARRALTHGLPEKVAAAAFEFISGPLAENPRRLGKQLHEPMFPLYSARRGEYRVIYGIEEDLLIVDIVSVLHRRDAYRMT